MLRTGVCLHNVGYEVCRASDDVPMIDISLAVKGWDSHGQCSPDHGPPAAPLGVVTCTYKQYMKPISSARHVDINAMRSFDVKAD